MSPVVIVGIVVFVLLAVLLWSQLVEVFQTLRAVFRRPLTGKEALRGKTATVRTALEPEGTVSLEGELWKAVSQEGYIEVGVTVEIRKIEGLKLFVIRKV
ncbi:MAG: serine protease [Dehalococcoidales bacterium]|nr:serine protease [Dehalococcoidales bacterium]